MSLGDEKYLLLTTYKKDGTAVPTAVWAVPLDSDKIGFWTSSGSGKAKRLAHTDRVLVQPCDSRGRARPGTQPTEGTAQLVSGAEMATINERVKAKYGVMTKITKLVGTVYAKVKRKHMPYGDRGVIITPAPAA